MAHPQTLVQALTIKKIAYEWLSGIWPNQNSIAIFNHSRRFSIHCHESDRGIYYCFYDSQISRGTIEHPLSSIEAMMLNFDRFILQQSLNTFKA
jgi:hypothetical protein